jgi:hypothetical protein
LETVNNTKTTYEKSSKDIKVKHTAQKDEIMKTVADGINKILENKIQEVDKGYDPACQKLSVQAETISNYLQKVEKSLQRTNVVLENSKLEELLSAQKVIDEDIRMLQNERPQNLTTFQVHVENQVSCVETLCVSTLIKELTDKCKYINCGAQTTFGIWHRLLFFVCNHVTFHPNDGQSNTLWTIFSLLEWLQQEKLNGNSSFES